MEEQIVADVRRPQSTSSSFWQYATLAALVVAAIAVGVGYLRYQKEQQLSAAVAQQAATIQAEAKPDLPLSVGFRRALIGTGRVLVLRNNSASDLDLAVIVRSDATGLVQRRELDVPANRVIQLGPAQGWSFAPGQRVVFRNVGFRPGVITVN